jgi:DNA primase
MDQPFFTARSRRIRNRRRRSSTFQPRAASIATPALSTQRIEGLVRHGAVEFYSWTPTSADPTRARFARILLEAPAGDAHVLNAALDLMEAILQEDGLQSLRVYDGGKGAALWIPFADSPSYEDLRLWLHARRASRSARSRTRNLGSQQQGAARPSISTCNPMRSGALASYPTRCVPEPNIPLQCRSIYRHSKNTASNPG